MDQRPPTPASDPGSASTARAADAAHIGPISRPAAATIGAAGPAAALSEHPGDMIGPYRLLEVLGEGGFGTVWLAERREPFVQRVAIKIIKAGMDTRAVIARFEQERQALAVMDHPSVAKVYDAGTTAQGRPYFVMEHVAGESITDYCDKHRLTLAQRLRLFIPVCQAVQHAHHKGIIHRDIKPSNILVGVHGDQPVPKVIDFGVAKAVSHSLTDKTIFTETGQIIGTPEYMSPEQAEMRGADIDTRTDVYSLGAVLYELLSGQVPFDSQALRSAGYAEIQRIIREVDPPKPSTRLTSLGAVASATIAQNRRSPQRQLASQLRDELDWIPLKALRKDRTERYDSPADLARDIDNYLQGRALEAGPESAAYRFKKLARRNRGVFAAGSAVAAALFVGVIGFAWQAHRIRLERDATAVERDRAIAAEHAAKDERDRATSIKDFLVQTLQSSDPGQEGRQDMLVSDAMLGGVRQLSDGALTDQPESRAEILGAAAEILRSNGKSGAALPVAQQALSILRGLHPGDHPRVAQGLDNLAGVLQTLGRASEAEPLYIQALEMNQRLFPGDHPDVANSLNNLASIRNDLGRPAEAEPLYQQALDMRRRLFKSDHPGIATVLGNLAGVRKALRRPAEAEPLYVQSLDMWRRLYKGDNPNVATCLNNLALLRMALGREAEAEPLLLQALEMNRRLFKGDHPEVATGLNNLASVRESLHRAAEAEALYVEALEMRRRLFTGDHPNVATSLNNLAYVRQALGRPAEAEPLYRQALEMNQRLYKGDHPGVAMSMTNLARVCHALGRPAEAGPLFDDAVAMLRRLSPQGSPALARVLWRSASARLDAGDAAGALPQSEEAVAMAESLLPSEHPQLQEYRGTLAKCREAVAPTTPSAPPKPPG